MPQPSDTPNTGEGERPLVALVTVPRIAGFLAALVIIALVAWLLRRGRLDRGVRIALLLVSVLLGVLIFSPMTVIAFQVLVLRLADLPGPLLLSVASFLAFIGLTAAFGRIFCGYCCPIGAAQELAYWIPCRKIVLRQASWIPLLRAGLITLLIVLALVASVNLLVTSLLVLRGARDAFVASGPSLFLFLFLGVLFLGVFLYRPFCRFACPFGAVLSLAALRSRYRIGRRAACTRHAACEAACPTGEAAAGKAGTECYVCGRCLDACPVPGARGYGRRGAVR